MGRVLQDLDQGGCFWRNLQLAHYGEGSSVKSLQIDHAWPVMVVKNDVHLSLKFNMRKPKIRYVIIDWSSAQQVLPIVLFHLDAI